MCRRGTSTIRVRRELRGLADRLLDAGVALVIAAVVVLGVVVLVGTSPQASHGGGASEGICGV